jgi:hypothetical protein
VRRSPQRHKLTLDEHRGLGLELAVMRDRLLSLSVDLANTYGETTPVGRAALASHDQIDRLRSLLDSRLADENPVAFSASVYYPAPDARRPASIDGPDEAVR